MGSLLSIPALRWDTADAEIVVPSAETPELSETWFFLVFFGGEVVVVFLSLEQVRIQMCVLRLLQ